MKNDKPNYKEGLKQLGKNVAVAGAGSAVGYMGGGLVAKRILSSPGMRKKLSKMTKAERNAFLHKVRMAGNVAGAAAGGLSSYAMSNALAKEKTASFFIGYAYDRLV